MNKLKLKQIIAIILAVLILVGVVASVFAQEIDLSKLTDEQLIELSNNIKAEQNKREASNELGLLKAEFNNYTLNVLSFSKESDAFGKACVVFKVGFTNNTQKDLMYSTEAFIAAYQNNTRLSYAVYSGEKDSSFITKPVKPAETAIYYEVFSLLDETSPVKLTVDSLDIFSSQEVTVEGNFELK